jgi:hypothetical protein
LFEELYEVYENQIAASLERVSGRDLFANELSCLCFWMARFPNQGALGWSEWQQLMTAFRFNLPDEASFRQEFGSMFNRV